MPLLTIFLATGAAGALLGRINPIRKAWDKVGKRTVPARSATPVSGEQGKKTTRMSAAELEAAQQQYIAVGALGMIGLGMVTLPVVGLLSLPFFALNYVYILRMVWRAFQQRSRNKISLAFIDLISVSAALWMGFLLTSAFLYLTFFTAGRLIARTEREAQTDFGSVFGELADTVWLVKEGVEVEVPLDSLHPGDVIVVRAGETVPIDGKVIDGEGSLDQHLLTGESQPVDKRPGDDVFTSTLVVAGSLRVLVERHGMETVTGQIAAILENAAHFKHHAQSRGERVVERGASLTLASVVGGMALIGINRGVALGYSGFGYQMRMAAPLMVLNYLRIASRSGLLVKDGRALDALQAIDTIVFDKTGTLTEEMPRVTRIVAGPGFDKLQVLRLAASAEQFQDHPVARAILLHADQHNVDLLELAHAEYAVGHGLKALLVSSDSRIPDVRIMIGSHRFMESGGVVLPESIRTLQAQADEQGFSVVYVATEEGESVGAIELRPILRRQAREAVVALHERGIRICIISGDREQPTRYLAEQLGIDDYFAETLPEAKARHVESLQQQGHKVCFVGDGINDSVALQTADVSISLHGASTIAQDTADIVLMQIDLMKLPYLLDLAGDLNRRMNRSELLNHVSGVACVSGVLLLGMGVGGAIALYSGGLLTNIGNAMLPLVKFGVKKDNRLVAPANRNANETTGAHPDESETK